jgi:hypothetical protein
MLLEAAILLTRPLLGFDPDEARDSHGEWTSGAFGRVDIANPVGKLGNPALEARIVARNNEIAYGTLDRLKGQYPGVVDILKKAPLQAISWVPQAGTFMTPENTSTSAYYNRHGEIVASLSPEVYAPLGDHRWNSEGGSFNVANGQRPEEAMTTTVVHEIGHHVMHQIVGKDDLEADAPFNPNLSALYHSYMMEGRRYEKPLFSRYGDVSFTEYFAETFAGYFVRPKDLEKLNNDGYKAMDQIVKGIGSGKIKMKGTNA